MGSVVTLFAILNQTIKSINNLQARVDEYLEWQHLNTRMMCAQYFIHRWLMPMQTKKLDEKKVAGAEKQMVSCINDFERVGSHLLGFKASHQIKSVKIFLTFS